MMAESVTKLVHTGFDIQGLLRVFGDESMEGVLTTSDGRPATDKEVREFLSERLKEGWKVIPFCAPCECPHFDYFGGGCPGHDVKDLEEED